MENVSIQMENVSIQMENVSIHMEMISLKGKDFNWNTVGFKNKFILKGFLSNGKVSFQMETHSWKRFH